MSMDQLYMDALRELEEVKAERDALAFQNKNREGLVRRAIEKEEQYDALAAHVERLDAGIDQLLRASSEDEADEALAEINNSRCTPPAISRARLDNRVAAEAMREIAEWMDPESEKFSGPTYHEAEMIGMEISGPTFCSDARRCMKAGNRAFLEAARIWEYKSRQAEAGAA